jgi:hypothetical protein
MERRRVLVTAALASSYLAPDNRGSGTVDVDQACATLKETVPLVQVLNTRRGIETVDQVRRQLASYQGQEPVRELEAALQPIIGASASGP